MKGLKLLFNKKTSLTKLIVHLVPKTKTAMSMWLVFLDVQMMIHYAKFFLDLVLLFLYMLLRITPLVYLEALHTLIFLDMRMLN